MASNFIQRAIASPSGLTRTKKLPFEDSEEVTLTPTQSPLSEDIETGNEEKIFPPNELYINMKLPPEVAILHVYENGDNEYSVWGSVNKGTPLLQTKPNKTPKSLGNFVEDKVVPRDIWGTMTVFSKYCREIRKWLNVLREQFGEQLCLVIADHTAFEIPWEMVELFPNRVNKQYQYLGALIKTARWRPVINDYDQHLMLDCNMDECNGNTVAYVLEELKGIEAELSILEALEAVVYRSSQHNITAFKDHLKQNDSNCGFVYISAHGTFSQNLHEIFIGSLKDEQQQLNLLDLHQCTLNLLSNSRSIVFINACHTARQEAHDFIPRHYCVGFVERFIAQGSRGVIATLGAVGQLHAANFARELIQKSLQSPNLSVAELLRQLRLRVVNRLLENPTEEDLLKFIYTFMYVYYGNPMTVLRLTPRGGRSYD